MKRVFIVLGVLFLIACKKSEVVVTSPPVVPEQSIKFTTSADTLTVSNNIIDTLPLSINLTSALPTSGLLFSIQLIRVDNSQVIYKIDTTLSAASLALKIPGFTTPTQYNLIITVSSKATPTNSLSKTISLNRFYIKSFISPNGFLNNKPVVDWTKVNGTSSSVWWDMDGDGNADKIYFSMNNSGFLLNIYKYKGSSYLSTVDVNNIVINDSLRKFYKSFNTNNVEIQYPQRCLSIVDFNKDSIPDILFSIEKQSEVPYKASALILVSKGWMNYELHVIPVNGHSQTVSVGDFNGDGYPDLFKAAYQIPGPSILYNEGLLAYHNITYLYPDYTAKESLLTSIGQQGDQGISFITDLDNNGIPDVIIGERDYITNMTAPIINGQAPGIFFNIKNDNWSKEFKLYDANMQTKWSASPHRMNGTQSVAFIDIDNDGLKDIVLNKYSSSIDGVAIPDSLKPETWIQFWKNNGGGNFSNITETWFLNNTYHFFLPLNSAGPFYTPGGGNPNPGDLYTGDVDGDGKVDIAFRYYGNIYFKNMGDHFEYQRNDNGFGFTSQSYKQPF